MQRAERVHVRDCRAEGEGQLGREDQGTESCGMPDAAAASAGWSPWTHCMYMARRGERLWPLGNTEVKVYAIVDGRHLSHSGLQTRPGRPLW